MSTIEVMRKALEALESPAGAQACSMCIEGPEDEYCCRSEQWRAVFALRAEIARLEAAEPVAWGMVNAETGLILDVICPEEHAREPGSYTIPLYAAPTPPAAIPALTDEETLTAGDWFGADVVDMARWAYALAAERAGVSIK